jgi:hypothetical protein
LAWGETEAKAIVAAAGQQSDYGRRNYAPDLAEDIAVEARSR